MVDRISDRVGAGLTGRIRIIAYTGVYNQLYNHHLKPPDPYCTILNNHPFCWN